MPNDSIRVLYIDDYEDLTEIVATFLRREDDRIKVETATTPKEGFKILDVLDIDCIISDYDLPGKNGIEILKEIREDYPDLPFILYTEKGSEEVASDAISAGVTDYLQKKSTTDQYKLLANQILNYVDKARTERDRERQLNAIETAQEGISILDEDGKFIYVNQAYADLYGYEPDEMIGEHWELLYRDQDLDEIYDEILPEVEEKGFWRGETVGVRADGSRLIEDHTLSRTDRGELVCTVRDVTDKKERERQFETLVSNLPGVVYRCKVEPGWPMEFVSEGVEELTGYTRDQLEKGEVVWGEDILHPDDRERAWKVVQDAMEKDEPFRIEYRIITKDGEQRWMWEQGRKVEPPSLDADTEILEGFIMDVTSEKKQREELRLKERAMDESPIGIIITEDTNEDGDNPIVYANGGFEEITGYPIDEIMGEDCRFLQGEETDPETVKRMREAIEEGRDVSVEVLNYKKDGTKFWNQVDISPIIDENGEVTNFVGFQREITEQKEYEEKLELFKKGAERSDYAIYMTDESGVIEYVNPAFEEITGYSKEEAIGRKPNIMRSGEMDDEYYDELWDTVMSGEVWNEGIVNRRKSGELYTAEQTIAPINNGDEIKGFVAIQVDVTEREARQQRLQVMDRVLRHNLRNKLNVVTGYTELLSDQVKDSEAKNYLDEIDETVTELMRESEKLRRFQELMDNEKAQKSKKVSIEKLLKRLEDETREKYPEAEVEFNAEGSEELRVEPSVRIALEELIENGVEHNDSDVPEIKITTSVDHEDGFLVIEVSDNGPGIPEHEKDVLNIGMETPMEHGSGIGLWIVYWIVKDAGGKINIEEKKEEGIISLKLPC